VKSDPGPPMTLGNAAAAHVRLIVWCKACSYQVEPDPGEMARRYGPETPVPDWSRRLVCSSCGSHDVDIVVTEERR
jgi:rubredoxin